MGVSYVDVVLGGLGKALLGLLGFLVLCLVVGVLREVRVSVENSAWFKKLASKRRSAKNSRHHADVETDAGNEGTSKAPYAKHNLKEKIQKVMKVNKSLRVVQRSARERKSSTPAALSRVGSLGMRKGLAQSTSLNRNEGDKTATAKADKVLEMEQLNNQEHHNQHQHQQHQSQNQSQMQTQSQPQYHQHHSTTEPLKTGIPTLRLATLANSRHAHFQNGTANTIAFSAANAADAQNAGKGQHQRRQTCSALSLERHKLKDRKRALSSKRMAALKRAHRPRESWSAFVQRQAGGYSSDDEGDLEALNILENRSDGDTGDLDGTVEDLSPASEGKEPGSADSSLVSERQSNSLQKSENKRSNSSWSENSIDGSNGTRIFPGITLIPAYLRRTLGTTIAMLLLVIMSICMLLSYTCAESTPPSHNSSTVEGVLVKARKCVLDSQSLRFANNAKTECAVFTSSSLVRQGMRSMQLLRCVADRIIWASFPETIKEPIDLAIATVVRVLRLHELSLGILFISANSLYFLQLLARTLQYAAGDIQNSGSTNDDRRVAPFHSGDKGARSGENSIAWDDSGMEKALVIADNEVELRGFAMFISFAIISILLGMLFNRFLGSFGHSNINLEGKETSEEAVSPGSIQDQDEQNVLSPSTSTSSESMRPEEARDVTTPVSDTTFDEEDQEEVANCVRLDGGNEGDDCEDAEACELESNNSRECVEALLRQPSNLSESRTGDESILISGVHPDDSDEGITWDSLSRTVSRDLYEASTFASKPFTGLQGSHRLLGRAESSPDSLPTRQHVDPINVNTGMNSEAWAVASARSHNSAPLLSHRLHGLNRMSSETSDYSEAALLEFRRQEAERLRIERLHERLQASLDRISHTLHMSASDERLATVRQSLQAVQESVYYRRGLKQ